MSTRDAQRLAAGLDEDELTARDPVEHLIDGGDHGMDFCAMPEWARRHVLRWTPGRAFRDIAAKRAILALYEEFTARRDQRTAHPQYAVEMACEVLEQVVKALAGVYQDAPAETAT